MKIIHSLVVFIFFSSVATAQKSDSTHTHYSFYRGLSAHETELKSKRGIKNGAYKVFSSYKIIARGFYKDDQRIGRWEFLNEKDSLEQIYNYTSKKIEYNLPNPAVKCYLDSLNEGDRVVYPKKVGGFTYGLGFMLSRFIVPAEISRRNGTYNLNYIFSIDEEGKLIKFETKVASLNYNRTEDINLKKLKPEDFEFTPAKLNGKNVASKMIFETTLGSDR